MREPIGPHQRPSVLMREPIGPHQRPSVLISVRRPVARRLPRESRAVGPAWRGAHAPVGRGGDGAVVSTCMLGERGEEHMHLWGEGGDGAVVSTCMLGERGEEHMHLPSAVMGGHGRSSASIRGHPSSSEVIRGHQWQSSPPRPAARFASPEGPPRTRRRTRCPRVDLRQ